MPLSSEKKAHMKEKAIEETWKLMLYTGYLAMVFVAFANYRRLILAEYQISYLHYGYAVVEAVVLAKIVLIGEALGVGERLSAGRPLIFAALFKSVLFALLAAVFAVLEHLVEGAIHHKDLATIWTDIVSKGADEMLARALVTVVAFIPFFAIWELQRLFPAQSFFDLIFKERPKAPLAPQR
jgi:hypothetical protein